MKQIIKWSAILAIAATAAFACTKPEPDPTPTPGPGPEVKAPVADFSYEIDGLKVTFTNKSTDAASYKWEFGDDETSKEQSPVHEYAAAGEYTVTLTAANSKGETNKKSVTISLAGKVQAYFSAVCPEGRDGEFGKGIQFDATASANAASIVWDFGDGESSTDFKPFHIFNNFGKYTVKITVTGVAGDVADYSAEVECVKNTMLIKGGSMEADDAQYWTVQPLWGYDNGQYADVEGVYAYAPVFGSTDMDLGHGGCYKFESNPLGWDYNNKGCITQAFEVREGDVIAIDCVVGWGEQSQDNGTFSIRANYGEWNEGESQVLFWFNNWWGVVEATETTERYTIWLPAFKGTLAQCAETFEGESTGGAGPEVGEIVDGKYRYTVTQTGKLSLSFFVNQVWGFAFGPGRDIYIDEITVEAVVE